MIHIQPGYLFQDREVLAVRVYTGKYPQWFTHFITITSDCRSGQIEMAVNEDDPDLKPGP